MQDNKTIIVVILIIVLALAGYFWLSPGSTETSMLDNNDQANDNQMADEGDSNSKMEDDVNDGSDTMMEEEDAMDDSSITEESDERAIDDSESVDKSGEYVSYSEEEFNSSNDKQRILFFHATWCPTCKVADTEISADLAELPSGVVVFKTDYDSEGELKKKYGITYQHTFVLVDANGEIIKKWNGGAIDEIVANVL